MNDQDKIAEQAAKIANLNLVLADRKAKIAELMGEAARAEIAGAPVRGAGEALRLIELLNAIKPNFGDVGSHDVDVRAQRERIEEAIAILSAAPAASAEQPTETAPAAFKNFHRALCDRFNYTHDEQFWWRDQVSLIEHIAASVPQLAVPQGNPSTGYRLVRAVAVDWLMRYCRSSCEKAGLCTHQGEIASPAAPLPEPTGPSEAHISALQKIARWHGEFPETGKTWDDGTPMSYGAANGSNGERDYMRQVALDALASPSPAPAQQQEPKLTLRDGIWWPEGYVTDPDGRIIAPAGRHTDFKYGYDQGYADGLVAIRDSVKAIESSALASVVAVLHYPGCWDTATYPALSDALSAVYDHFKCSECAAPGASIGDKQ